VAADNPDLRAAELARPVAEAGLLEAADTAEDGLREAADIIGSYLRRRLFAGRHPQMTIWRSLAADQAAVGKELTNLTWWALSVYEHLPGLTDSLHPTSFGNVPME